MNTARHEAGHAVAIHLLGLTDVLRPGGAALREAGGGGGVVLDRPECDADEVCRSVGTVTGDAPCQLAVRIASERPDLAPALILFLAVGFAATADGWRSTFWPAMRARMSGDLEAIRMIISDLLNTSDYLANNFVSEWAYECLMRAVEWCERPEVARLIDQAALYLDRHHAATWSELEQIFTSVESAGHDSTAKSVDVPASTVLADGEAGASGDIAQSPDAGNGAPSH